MAALSAGKPGLSLEGAQPGSRPAGRRFPLSAIEPLSRHYVKLCDARDFADPALLAMIRSVVPERDPLAHIERKVWEYAMVALFLEEVGRLDGRTEALSVGAGSERILFWLANRVGRMVATDVYGAGPFSGEEADAAMLTNPGIHAPYPYREDRLEIQWMDGRQLAFADASFDVVFTISSIEHFGTPGHVARAAGELGRVLRPGGQAVIITECFIRHPLRDRAPLSDPLRSVASLLRGRRPTRPGGLGQVFRAEELTSLILRPAGLRLLQPLRRTVSSESWKNVTRQLPDGRLVPSSGQKYPHILVQIANSVFTSVCLIAEKPR